MNKIYIKHEKLKIWDYKSVKLLEGNNLFWKYYINYIY